VSASPTSQPRPPSADGARAVRAAGAGPDLVVHNVEEISRIEQRDRIAKSRSDRVADLITAFSGSMLYVYLHVIWFAAWIVLNLGWFGGGPFDPFPFGLLTMIVSLEAIFLSTFVLISQNRQALHADRRQKVNMEVDIIAEQEITKLMQMVSEIRDALSIKHVEDPEVQAMERPTHLEQLAEAIDAAEQDLDSDRSKGLGSTWRRRVAGNETEPPRRQECQGG
jgi:uncharacterized membrane protein